MAPFLSNRPSHHLPLPIPIFALKVAQLVLAVVILGLSAYGVTYLAFAGICLSLFTSLVTMIIAAYFIVSSLAVKAAYNYWALVGLDIFAIIFWLISFSVTASQVAAHTWSYNYSSYACSYYYGYCDKNKKRDLAPRYVTTNVYTYRNSMAASAGLGGLEFILFIITLVFTVIYLLRHRKAGGHSTPARPGQTGPAGVASVPMYATEPKPGQQYPQQPQQQYPQPPQPQQQYVQQPQQPGYQPVQTPPPQQPGYQPVQTPSPQQPGYQPVQTPPPQQVPYQPAQSPPPNNHQLPA